MRLRSVFKMRMSILNTATTEHLGYGIISFFCVLAPEGMNAIVFGERRGRSRKVVAYSDTVSTMLSMMIRWYRQLPLYTINSPLYCSNISFFSRDIFRICDKGDFFNIYIFGKWQSTFSLLLVKSEKIIFWRYIFRASRNLSDLFPLSLPDTIAFIPSEVNTQKKEIIPYPRCGFGACLRCGWVS